MRPCGCQAGRPCTCEMKEAATSKAFACGVCVNCRLTAREGTRARRRSSGPRQCLKSAQYFAELAFDRVVLRENCAFRMRKPDWDGHAIVSVDEKTPMYNKLHQMRLAMIQTRTASLATIATQKKLRVKYSNDLRKTQEAIEKLEQTKMEATANTRKTTKEQLLVDSDVFDSFSKQLIDAETLLPNLKTRLEKATTTIAMEQKNIKIIREYVWDFAVRKLQTTIRAFFRFREWKSVLQNFQEDVLLSATVVIQATWRMFTAKKQMLFLLQLRHDQAKGKAASAIRRFSVNVIGAKHQKKMVSAQEAETLIVAQKLKSFDALFEIFGRRVLHGALVRWKEGTYEARIRTLQKTSASVILIQRTYRGFRDRIYLKRIKMRRSLTGRVGALVDQFIVSGDFWGFVLEIDADYRRFTHKIKEEEEDAATFMSTVLRQRKLDEDQMMQDWFTASALQNPLINGIDQVTKTYNRDEGGNSNGSSVSQAMLQSALVEDLVVLSPNKRRGDVFPADFPPNVIRQALAKGFALDAVIAVMRGLQAQRKNIEDVDLVLATLEKRSPLMTNPWTSERVLRETRALDMTAVNPIPIANSARKGLVKTSAPKMRSNTFISENLLDSIPGGMNAPIARLLLVAALRCFDGGSRGGKGTFVPCDGRNSELFQSYLRTESPLVKIRSEQRAMEAVKPYLQTLLENRCYTAYDILYNVRGIGELVSWNLPGALAKSIYSVIQEIHVQSTHISKRNVIKEVRVSADFEQFLKVRKHERKKLPSPHDSRPDEAPAQVPAACAEPIADSVFIQVKSRLEAGVLGLPLEDISISASDLLFKAAFLVNGNAGDPTTADTYQTFLRSLVKLQTAGGTEVMKELIAARVTHAKAIADGYADIFLLFAVATADDLLVS
ncbi:hypothetical protein PHYPSEUDO_013731 [Phytophthora pseudosyringae]|uniref:Uncharacterized protein n=1 Tax=Phytophthora pseudosyringae TaxID=221518 RepID=A0A8T1W3B0_9STRA|nr:hypothetical protein PHYPSEUDO_013731 [Phytophthora pseudosyringae]